MNRAIVLNVVPMIVCGRENCQKDLRNKEFILEYQLIIESRKNNLILMIYICIKLDC